MKLNAASLSEQKTRITKTKILIRDGSEWCEEEIEIEYFSDCLSNYKERFKDLNIEEVDLAQALARRIASFPNVFDEEGKPVAVTSDYLKMFLSVNLKRISDAIQADISPNIQPAS